MYKVVPHYNVMGIAEAALEISVQYLAIELGPANIRVKRDQRRADQDARRHCGLATLATSSSGANSTPPLRHNVTIEHVGGSGLKFLSDLSSSVTGETHLVASGYYVVGLEQEDAPAIALGGIS